MSACKRGLNEGASNSMRSDLWKLMKDASVLRLCVGINLHAVPKALDKKHKVEGTRQTPSRVKTMLPSDCGCDIILVGMLPTKPVRPATKVCRDTPRNDSLYCRFRSCVTSRNSRRRLDSGIDRSRTLKTT